MTAQPDDRRENGAMHDWRVKAADQAWVDLNRPALDLAFATFLISGEWPKISDVQRDLDRANTELDVALAMQRKPAEQDETHLLYVTHVTLHLRQLYWLPQACDLLATCWLALRRAVDVYLSDDPALQLSSADDKLRSAMTARQRELLPLAAPLISADYPSPLSGGSFGPDEWNFFLDGAVARRLRDCESLEEYFALQTRILEERRAGLVRPSGLSEAAAMEGASDDTAANERSRSPFTYDIALSFAGEDRPYVDEVAQILRAEGVDIFYDADAKTEMWGRELSVHFDEIYRLRSRFAVVFVSEHYIRKPWTNHERRSALARAIKEVHQPYLLPVRFDDSELPGVAPTVGYVDGRETTPSELAALILAKLGTPPCRR
jgi:hypothetical protein